MEKSLDSILGDFNPNDGEAALDERECISIWVTPEYHARYERLQRSSRRRFCKKLRKVIEATIEIAEKRTG